MSTDRCGKNPAKQKKILKSYGFVPLQRRQGGSHVTYRNSEIQALACEYKIEIPANIKTGSEQALGEVVVANPTKPLWDSIVKYAKWCHERVELLTDRAEIRNEFYKAASRPAKAGKRKKDPHYTKKTGIPLPPGM